MSLTHPDGHLATVGYQINIQMDLEQCYLLQQTHLDGLGTVIIGSPHRLDGYVALMMSVHNKKNNPSSSNTNPSTVIFVSGCLLCNWMLN